MTRRYMVEERNYAEEGRSERLRRVHRRQHRQKIAAKTILQSVSTSIGITANHPKIIHRRDVAGVHTNNE